jgi:hypothetical protein
MTANSNRLPILAAEIQAAHAAALAAARTSVEKAVEAGKLLIEAKAALPHGQWLPWLRDIGLSPRTAQRYMQLALVPADKYVTVADLGIKRALEAIAELPACTFMLPLPGQVSIGRTEVAGYCEEAFVWPSNHDGFFHLFSWVHSPTRNGAEATCTKKPLRGDFVLQVLTCLWGFPIDRASWLIEGDNAGLLEEVRRYMLSPGDSSSSTEGLL